MAEIVKLDNRAAERAQFLKLVAAQRDGHDGDIAPRSDYSIGVIMSADYPTVADGSVPAVEQK